MKILGIGVDLIHQSRIQQLLKKTYANRFLKKVLYHEQLIKLSSFNNQKKSIQYVSSRWAVKQAIVKAINRKDIIFNEIYIDSNQNGKPQLKIQGCKNKAIMKELNIIDLHLSISHDIDYTIANVIAIIKQQ